jgi:hypothetical protein
MWPLSSHAAPCEVLCWGLRVNTGAVLRGCINAFCSNHLHKTPMMCRNEDLVEQVVLAALCYIRDYLRGC